MEIRNEKWDGRIYYFDDQNNRDYIIKLFTEVSVCFLLFVFIVMVILKNFECFQAERFGEMGMIHL